ncbi:HPF/RaiA family ribosome-associated protein [Azospirillum thermophilum]|uniref:RNA polymerase subunit sigma-54 n=1 Tax=Azospirillum thermophilum TaxID=2202148 RepID=A0A2S2CYN9_9PROT|nr:HPF/RaiA family ribosome-associated protein [Azospirillum thermophilum]AWK89357.1 RNA polymerase subunit sigma-54 [Azospirillum thermophilum]
MRLPLQIVFRNMDPSPALDFIIREQAGKLERFCQDIMGCRVIVESPHRHQYKGKLYEVRIVLTVPQAELVTSRQGPEDQAHEDPRVAIRDAFDAMRRELEDYTRRLRQDVKAHALP